MTLEEKAKQRRAEAWKNYSPRMKGRMDVIRSSTKRRKQSGRSVSPPPNPKEGTIGILSRKAG